MVPSERNAQVWEQQLITSSTSQKQPLDDEFLKNLINNFLLLLWVRLFKNGIKNT